MENISDGDVEVEKIKKELEKKEEKKFIPMKIGELLRKVFTEEEWLIEKIIPQGCLTIISGPPANYKTFIMLHMAICISKGEPLFGTFGAKSAGVLMIDEENDSRLLQKRLRLLGAEENLPIHILSRSGFFAREKAVDEIIKICDELNIGAVFMDSLVRINTGDENDATQMALVFRNITKLCSTGKTVIIAHHERKEGLNPSSAGNRMRGSSDILAVVDSHISVKKDRSDRKKIVVEQTKMRQCEELKPFELHVEGDENGLRFNYLGEKNQEVEKKFIACEIIVKILENFPEGLSQQDLVSSVMKEIKIGDKAVRSVIKELLSGNDITESKGRGSTKMYRLNNQELPCEIVSENV